MTQTHKSKDVELFTAYLCNRPEKGLCLAHTKLNIQPDPSDKTRLECETEDVKRKLKEYGGQDPHQLSKGTDLILKHLESEKVNNGLQISFWCQSGTKCFKPTEESKKNCAEVAMMGVVELILQSVEGKVSKADINWTADLTPCQVCTMRLPNQQAKLKTSFPNTEFSYSHQAALSYDKYEELPEEIRKALKTKELWSRLKEEITKQLEPEFLTLEIVEEIAIGQKGELLDTSPAA